jgi:hypothetical protein
LFECTINPDDSSQEEMYVKISKGTGDDAENLQIDKDRTLKINLDNGTPYGYDNYIQVHWSGNADVVFNLDYIASDGSYRTLKGVQKGAGAVIADPNNYNCYNFDDEDGGEIAENEPGDYHARINIQNLIDDPDCGMKINQNDTPKILALRLKPLMPGDIGVANFWVYGSSSLPPQAKSYIAEAYSTVEGQTDTPKAIVELLQPLNNPPIEILDYVLRTQDVIDK